MSLTHGEQPLVGQGIQHHPCVLVPASGELGQGHAAADHRLALARPGQPQQDPAGGLLLAGVELPPGPLGQAGDRPMHPTGLMVGGQRQGAALAVLPALQQRARQ